MLKSVEKFDKSDNMEESVSIVQYRHFAFNTGTLCFTQPPDANSQPPDTTFSTS